MDSFGICVFSVVSHVIAATLDNASPRFPFDVRDTWSKPTTEILYEHATFDPTQQTDATIDPNQRTDAWLLRIPYLDERFESLWKQEMLEDCFPDLCGWRKAFANRFMYFGFDDFCHELLAAIGVDGFSKDPEPLRSMDIFQPKDLWDILSRRLDMIFEANEHKPENNEHVRLELEELLTLQGSKSLFHTPETDIPVIMNIILESKFQRLTERPEETHHYRQQIFEDLVWHDYERSSDDGENIHKKGVMLALIHSRLSLPFKYGLGSWLYIHSKFCSRPSVEEFDDELIDSYNLEEFKAGVRRYAGRYKSEEGYPSDELRNSIKEIARLVYSYQHWSPASSLIPLWKGANELDFKPAIKALAALKLDSSPTPEIKEIVQKAKKAGMQLKKGTESYSNPVILVKTWDDKTTEEDKTAGPERGFRFSETDRTKWHDMKKLLDMVLIERRLVQFSEDPKISAFDADRPVVEFPFAHKFQRNVADAWRAARNAIGMNG